MAVAQWLEWRVIGSCRPAPVSMPLYGVGRVLWIQPPCMTLNRGLPKAYGGGVTLAVKYEQPRQVKLRCGIPKGNFQALSYNT